MISLLVPTRGRPDRFAQMLASVRATAKAPVEVCAWLDLDDLSEYPQDPGVRYGAGERPYVDGVLCTSDLWNRALELATGDILMMGADDITFRTRGWDVLVEQAFAEVPDRIVLVYPWDGTRRKAPVNPCLSRRWVDAVGFTPPGWPGWMADEWIWAIAAELRRVVFLPDAKVLHPQKRQGDDTYRDGEAAREQMGGLAGLRSRFYSTEMTARRDEQTDKLRALMQPGPTLVPDPMPEWFTEALEGSRMARGTITRDDTLVVVHCYAGDAHLVEAYLPQYLHHGCKVLILSPEDAPVRIEHPGVECRQAGQAAYFGQASLDRQRLHLELLLEYPHRYYLLNDADSMCLSAEIPAYLYGSTGTVWSNEVRETRPHPSPYPKIAMQPPYFMDRDTLARLVAVPYIEAHPITPYIDWLMVALVSEAGLEHRSFPDGKSMPAWRHGPIPETQQLGHNYVHVQEAKGFDGAQRMRLHVRQGVVMVHSIKHPPVRDLLVRDRAQYVTGRR